MRRLVSGEGHLCCHRRPNPAHISSGSRRFALAQPAQLDPPRLQGRCSVLETLERSDLLDQLHIAEPDTAGTQPRRQCSQLWARDRLHLHILLEHMYDYKTFVQTELEVQQSPGGANRPKGCEVHRDVSVRLAHQGRLGVVQDEVFPIPDRAGPVACSRPASVSARKETYPAEPPRRQRRALGLPCHVSAIVEPSATTVNPARSLSATWRRYGLGSVITTAPAPSCRATNATARRSAGAVDSDGVAALHPRQRHRTAAPACLTQPAISGPMISGAAARMLAVQDVTGRSRKSRRR